MKNLVGVEATRSAWSAWPALACIAGAILFMLIAAALYWPTPEFAFLSDQSVVSWLSSAQLWAIALLALHLGAERTLSPRIAVWLFGAMLAMACDEQFMLHEQWKYGCAQWWSVCQLRWGTELPMLLVGMLGLATAVCLHSALPGAAARLLLWCALLTGLLALSIDLFAWMESLSRYEEGFEVLAEAFLAAALIGVTGPSDTQVHSV